MNLRVLFYVVATLVAGLSNAARAEAPLSLAVARAEARAHAPDAAVLDARLRGATGIADEAGRAQRKDPVLSLGALSGAPTGEPDEYGWNIGVAWTVDITGSWGPRQRAARAREQEAVQQREDGLRALDEAVAIGVANLAYAQRALARCRRIEQLHALGLDAAKKQLDVGQGNALDADAAALDLAGAREAKVRASGELEVARAELSRLLGRTSDGQLAVEEARDIAAPPTDFGFEHIVERDPRVLAARQALDATNQEIAMYKRARLPNPTIGINYESRHRLIPTGAFSGPAAAGLSGNWNDSEIGATLTIPIPILDRQTQPLAETSARNQQALAQLEVTRANIRMQLRTTLQKLRAAASAVDALGETPLVVEQDFALLEKALRAGALDAVTRAQHLRRLEEASRRYDQSILNLRVARAHFERCVVSR